jgi:hypothetical protein
LQILPESYQVVGAINLRQGKEVGEGLSITTWLSDIGAFDFREGGIGILPKLDAG